MSVLGGTTAEEQKEEECLEGGEKEGEFASLSNEQMTVITIIGPEVLRASNSQEGQ